MSESSTAGDLERQILAGERTHVDLKAAFAWGKNKTTFGVIRDMLAMANSGGGLIVIGASENGSGGFSYTGVPSDLLASFDPTKVMNLTNEYANPAIRSDVEQVRLSTMMSSSDPLVVLKIYPFNNAPHYCARDLDVTDEQQKKGRTTQILRRGALYARNHGAESREISSADDFNELIEHVFRARQASILERIRQAIDGGNETINTAIDQKPLDIEAANLITALDSRGDWNDPGRPRWIHLFHPTYMRERRFSLKALEDALRKSRKQYRFGSFIEEDHHWNGFERLDDAVSFRQFVEANDIQRFEWMARDDGTVAVILPAWEARKLEYYNKWWIDPQSFAFNVVAAVDFLCSYFELLGVDDEPITWEMRLERANDHQVLAYGGISTMRESKITSDRLTWRDRHVLTEWQSRRRELEISALRHFFERFGWPIDSDDYFGWLIENV